MSDKVLGSSVSCVEQKPFLKLATRAKSYLETFSRFAIGSFRTLT